MTALDPIGDAAGEACGLSAAPRMRYWKPADELAPFISGYHLYAVATPEGRPHRDVFQPAWANLRIRLTRGSGWRVHHLDGEWVHPGLVSLFGPSSAVTWSESETGLIVGAGILPLGWNRLFGAAARDWADRIDALPALGPFSADLLQARFCSLHEDEAVPKLFDKLFAEALRPASKDDATIVRIESALVDPAIDSVGELSEATGVPVRALERLSRRAFGFPPKLLMRRARFLRSLDAVRHSTPAGRTAAIDACYTDYSHFVRDSHAFLGMSPQAFLKLDTPLLKESLALRKKVLGAPAQALAAPAHSGNLTTEPE